MTREPMAIVESVTLAAMREINALDQRIVRADDDADGMLWEQARLVVEQLQSGRTQREVAAQWVNARTGQPYNQKHVSYVARAFEQLTAQPRPRFRDVYNAIANASRDRAPEPVADRLELVPEWDEFDEDDEDEGADDEQDDAEPDEDEEEDENDDDDDDEPPSRLAVHFSSESPEHYTPAVVLAWVRAIFGDVPDLDPCSNSHERPNVPARAHFTATDDGCARPWHGRVFLNPPYGRELPAWINKLRAEWAAHHVQEVLALLPSRTDTAWFDALTRETDDAVVCFLHGRLTFVGNTDPAPFPSMLVYFGDRPDVFVATLIEHGSIWQRAGRGQR